MSEVLTHRGSTHVTRAELAQYAAPIGSPTHKPIAHAELVDTLTERLAARSLVIERENFAVSASGMQIFGVFDFAPNGHPTLPGIGGAMGFRAANDKTLAVQIVSGAHVVICDNLVLSGSAIVLKRRHTRALDLASEINLALDRFEQSQRLFMESITVLQEREIDDDDAKVAIFDLCYKGVIGSSLFSDVSAGYFKAELLGYEDCLPRTAWGLHNAVTRSLKALSPASQFRATVAIGKHFGLGVEAN
jgi:hypothetical protein